MLPDRDAEPSPIAIGVIETDSFCDRCGFNLHTQKVWRDGRLGILVCRCPECGAHQTAGTRTSAVSGWLTRLAIAGLVIWTTLAIAFVISAFGVMFAVQEAGSEVFTHRGFQTRDGREPVHQSYGNTTPTSSGPRWVLSGRADASGGEITAPANDPVVYRVELFNPIRRWMNEYRPHVLELAVVVALFGGGVFMVGVLAAAGSWFWRPRSRLAWLALPVLAAILALAIEASDANNGSYYYNGPQVIERVGRDVIYKLILAITLVQIALLGIALLVGRPIVRFALTVLVPPRSRQLFAFLWHCDGKTMPAATPTV